MNQAVLSTTGKVSESTDGANQSTATMIFRPVPQGLTAWLPALAILIVMPLLALSATKYALRAFTQEDALYGMSASGQNTAQFVMETIPIKLSTDPNTRSGFRSIALVGGGNDFKSKIAQNMTKLTDVAVGDLRGKTISDMYAPGALDAMRAQILADVNRALGERAVQEVYITGWPSK